MRLLLAATLLFRLSDPRIDEASGIAYGSADPGVVYVQNDSGDRARFFALDATTGAVRAVLAVPGATNVDWEDLAVAPDASGVASVWVGDIGDNRADRPEIRIYRVDEPARATGDQVTSAPQFWRLRYPDGPTDAEGLAVTPTGRAYIVTKNLGGSRIYAVPPRPDPARVQTVSLAGQIRFGLTGSPGGPNVLGQLTATGAAISADGAWLTIRTYTDAYVWPLHDGDVAHALTTEPARVALPAQPQGEGITIHDGRLVIDSEKVGSPVYAVALPTGPTRAPPAPPVVRRRSRWVPLGWTAGAGIILATAFVLTRRLRQR